MRPGRAWKLDALQHVTDRDTSPCKLSDAHSMRTQTARAWRLVCEIAYSAFLPAHQRCLCMFARSAAGYGRTLHSNALILQFLYKHFTTQ
jgi:hypothetical protein